MRTMQRLITATTLVLWTIASASLRADEPEDKAIQAIEKAGGKVFRLDPLIYVILRDADIKDVTLKDVAALKQLDNLIIGGTKITDAGLKELAACKQLRRL